MSSLYLPSQMKESRAPSFISLNKDFILLKPNKSGELLRGPRRVVRLCVFTLLLPAVLITVPLYVRLMLYPPTQYPMMPTDQRLLAHHASSFWCQAQSTHMNGSFTSYLTRGKPELRPDRRTYVMLNHMKAQDDVKEYWGFYLLKGSTVTISSCARWAGGQVMILRGVDNLHRCAWIGEEDSAENSEEDDDEASNERHRLEDLKRAREPSVYQAPDDYRDPEAGIGAEALVPDAQPLHSEERRQGITKLLRKALKLSKDKKEILRILHSEGKRQNSQIAKKDGLTLNNNTKSSVKLTLADQAVSQDGTNQTQHGEAMHTEQDALTTPTTPTTPGRLRKANKRLKGDPWREARRRLNKKRRKKGNTRDKNLTEEDQTARTRLRREAVAAVAAAAEEEEEDTDGAFEELDTEDVLDILIDDEPSKTRAEERVVGAQVFFPEGLKYERGTFNQTTGNDNSREEQVSSFSSSEEALASCEGVIINLQLVPYRRCNYQSLNLNKISYDIPITGTYYFVFSSDNEIYVNDIFFNVTMERVVYNVSKTEEMCTNTTDCLMPLSFWSNEQTVVEVPVETTWDHSYVMEVKCEPRVYIYLCFLLLVPLFIMCCALY